MEFALRLVHVGVRFGVVRTFKAGTSGDPGELMETSWFALKKSLASVALFAPRVEKRMFFKLRYLLIAAVSAPWTVRFAPGSSGVPEKPGSIEENWRVSPRVVCVEQVPTGGKESSNCQAKGLAVYLAN